MCSDTPETGQNQGLVNFFAKLTLQILLASVPRINSSKQEAIKLLYDTLPLTFFRCFGSYFCRKRIFSKQNASEIGLKRHF